MKPLPNELRLSHPRRIRKFAVLLIVTALALATISANSRNVRAISALPSAQDNMSYSDAVDWITENTNQSVKMVVRAPDVFVILISKDLKIDGCSMSWKSNVELHRGESIVFTNNTVTVPMRDVSTVEVVTDNTQGEGLFSAVMKTANGKKSVMNQMVMTRKGFPDDSQREEKTEGKDNAGIVFDDEALARKFSKALQFVFKHCGDK